MYKMTDNSQSNFLNFNQPMGLHMNPNNRWIQMANLVPWDTFEERYAKLFSSYKGNVAKPLRLALGSLIIQKRYGYSDRELVEQLTENPYYQYFIGLPGYQDEAPFDASTLVLFRKRLSMDIINEANEQMLHEATQDADADNDADNDHHDSGEGGESSSEEEKKPTNQGTLIIDSTCAPVEIRYPQDCSLLNEAREILETIIIRFCKSYGLPRPRMYRRVARKNYLSLAKMKKRTRKKIRATIRKQLSYVRRDIKYLEEFMAAGYAPNKKEIQKLLTIYKLFEQQDYMYKNEVNSVDNRIVSIHQPWLRPIVRGKVTSPVEFGVKFDLSLDDKGYGRIEKASFSSYNESTIFKEAIERYKERTGYYPKRVLVDKIYRTRENLKFCKEHGIRVSGPKLGRPSERTKAEKKVEYQDSVDRIEVERAISLSKRCYGLGLIRTRLEETTLTSVALSVFVTNLFKMQSRVLFELFFCNPKNWQFLLNYQVRAV
jgi:IS5 family transposase